MFTTGIHYFKTIESAFFYKYVPEKDYKGHRFSWYEDGAKFAEGYYHCNIKIGVWKTWYKNGNRRNEETYIDGKLNGLCGDWHKNGNKYRECTYIDDKKNGLLESWDENGNECTYIKGKQICLDKECNAEYLLL